MWYAPRHVNRRSLSPTPVPASGLPQRRASGARREVSDRVRLLIAGTEVEGWALNISNGGLRCIVDTDGINLEELFELGRVVSVHVGDAAARPARIVWVQSEPDGAIVGVAFTDRGEDDQPLSAAPQGAPKR
ncbi:MAG: PilZ domain-containing protein [Polyangiaceae bacterium]